MNQIETFKNLITILDTETTNLQPELCEIVEVAGTVWHNGTWESSGMLLGAHNGIPPEASAKNNISNKMISGLLTFDQNVSKVKQLLNWPHSKWYVAHNAEYDKAALKHAFSKIDSSSDIVLCEDQSRWICTWRLSKQILCHEFNDIQYGLNYLRYKLNLPIADSVGVHRAEADTYVTAILLDKLIELALTNKQISLTEDIGVQLNKLCWGNIPVTVWPFGKYRGKLLEELDNEYYTWALKNLPQFNDSNSEYDADLVESVRQVLEKRLSA